MRAAYGVLLLAILCFSATNGQWLGGDFLNLNNMFANIHQNIQHNVRQLNQQIRNNVRGYFTEMEQFHKDMQRKLGSPIPVIVDPGKGSSIVISNTAGGGGGSAGTSRTVYSGYTPEGEPYYRDSERSVVNGILHHFERAYDPNSKKVKEHHYTLDLNDPKAKPIEIRVDSTDEDKETDTKEAKETKE